MGNQWKRVRMANVILTKWRTWLTKYFLFFSHCYPHSSAVPRLIIARQGRTSHKSQLCMTSIDDNRSISISIRKKIWPFCSLEPCYWKMQDGKFDSLFNQKHLVKGWATVMLPQIAMLMPAMGSASPQLSFKLPAGAFFPYKKPQTLGKSMFE